MLIGATTIHLQHEFFLLLSLCMLTASSLAGMYRRSFGTVGDVLYILLSSGWLSRHIFFRYLYTTNTTSTKSRNFYGVVVHWITKISVAGQYFDAPDFSVVNRGLGISQVDDVLNPSNQISFPNVTFAVSLLRVYVMDPLLRLVGRSSFPLDFNGSFQNLKSHQLFQKISQSIPPIQMMVAIFSLGFCLYFFQGKGGIFEVIRFSMSLSLGESEPSEVLPKGTYEPMLPASWIRTCLYMSCGPTILSILFYGRIFLPIPDLVAGTNVLKSIRNEAKRIATKSQRAKSQKEQQDGPWAESYKSIVGENRFRLACIVSLLRTLDAILCCFLLPRTSYVCRVTGHCPSMPTMAQLSRTLYPQGITGVLRDDQGYTSQSFSINSDSVSAFFTILSLIFITNALLLAQLITLNRSYLAIMGHLAGEWKLVGNKQVESATPWDPRRRFKKGDLVVDSSRMFGNLVYMATTNSPEGRPFDLFLRATNYLFRNELGQQSTSALIYLTFKIHLCFMLSIFATIIYYASHGYHTQSLTISLMANMFACVGILYTGVSNRQELKTVASEVNRS